LIHPEYVLTAAHCFYPAREAAPYGKVYVGEHKTCFYGNCGAATRNIAELILHPGYDDLSSENDIAILKLDAPVYHIEPIGLQTTAFVKREEFGGNRDAVVLGWGTDDVELGTMGQVLQRGDLTMVSRYSCYSDYAYRFAWILEGMVCATSRTAGGGTDACQGDSGGA
jgi:secreted trypsin-like serine protease